MFLVDPTKIIHMLTVRGRVAKTKVTGPNPHDRNHKKVKGSTERDVGLNLWWLDLRGLLLGDGRIQEDELFKYLQM